MRTVSAAAPTRRVVLGGVALLCCAVLTLGWWSKARCLGDGGWTGGQEYTELCYTDVYALWFATHLHEGAPLYDDHPGRDHALEYPVLTGTQLWGAAQVAALAAPERRAEAFFHITAAFGAVAALVTLSLLLLAGVPPSRLLWWAGAPTLALTAFINWDLVPIALLVAGVVAHLRGRDGLAGVAVGLGTAAKLFPALLVPLVIGARLAQRRPRAAALHAGAAGGVWLAVNLPVFLTANEGWWRFIELNRERPANWDSLWFLAQDLRGAAFDVSTINTVSALAFLAGAAVIVAFGVRSRDPERWWELALPLFAWFLLTNKVYSPQFSLWLLPLMALVLPRTLPAVAFLVADAVAFVLLFRFLGGVMGFEPAPAYDWLALAVVARALVLAWVVIDSTRASAPAVAARGAG